MVLVFALNEWKFLWLSVTKTPIPGIHGFRPDLFFQGENGVYKWECWTEWVKTYKTIDNMRVFGNYSFRLSCEGR